jgi:hypothetical protein
VAAKPNIHINIRISQMQNAPKDPVKPKHRADIQKMSNFTNKP